MLYLSADDEDRWVIAQANAPLTPEHEFVRTTVSTRNHGDFRFRAPSDIDFMDIAPRQIVGVSAALIPFLEHDDANRALMGSNMQTQAVPLIRPEVPLVSTGMERQAAIDSGQVVVADVDGEVESVTGSKIVVRSGRERRQFNLRKYNRSNQSTCIDQRPAVIKGQRVHKGDIIADSSSTANGELALGQNVLCAFLSWEGGNYEDAILISERLVQEDHFTSVHIEKHEVEARDTKLGPEEITYDIPNVGDEALRDLDEDGIIRVGAEVGPNDILVGKITPKGEKELTPEEKLLRAIFGEKAREVKDTSLRMPHGERGKVVDVKVFTREEHRDLPAGRGEDGARLRGAEAQGHRRRQDGRAAREQGRDLQGRPGGGYAVPRGRHARRPHPQSAGRPRPHEHRPDPRNPPGVGGRPSRFPRRHAGVRRGRRSRDRGRTGARLDDRSAPGRKSPNAPGPGSRTRATTRKRPSRTTTRCAACSSRTGWSTRAMTPNRWPSPRSTPAARPCANGCGSKGFDPDGMLTFEGVPPAPDERARLDAAAIDACLRLWVEAHGGKGKAAKDIRATAEQTMAETRVPLPILGKQMLLDGKTRRSPTTSP